MQYDCSFLQEELYRLIQNAVITKTAKLNMAPILYRALLLKLFDIANTIAEKRYERNNNLVKIMLGYEDACNLELCKTIHWQL